MRSNHFVSVGRTCRPGVLRAATSLLCAAMLCSALPAGAQTTVNSDHWAATDALGRRVGDYASVPGKDKTVIMFYWTWHQMTDNPNSTPKNITEILRKHPEARQDINHPAWHDKYPGNYYHWDEPIFGYYRTTDRWVLRKHAELLADAKVDAVFFDCTNGSLTWDESTDALLETWEQASRDGVKVPKIGFLLPFGPVPHSLVSLRHLYGRLYKPGKFRDLWFCWEGKPCIMAYPDNLTDSDEDRAIREFFTFRPGQPDYVDGPAKHRNDQWGWLENYPQHGYVKGADGTCELVTVGVSQNACPETNGHCSAFNLPGSHARSYTVRKGFDPRQDGYLYGWNFEEQWDRAYELDPKAVFVTGWNEWIAGMWTKKDGWTGVPFSFVDEYDADHSRDIEPAKSWGDCGDVYYLQLVDRVRKFKGTDVQERPSAPKTIRLTDMSDWEDVKPAYAAYKGNTGHRDALGKSNVHYVDNSGRNDITGAKVARDNDYVYFYVETAGKLTPCTDSNWMMLFIDADRSKQTGWQGYDFVVNYKSPGKKKACMQQSVQNKWIWKDCAEPDYTTDGNRLVLRIPRKLLAARGGRLDFEFKWCDNMQDLGNVMDFYVSGDVAPGGRFNYVYSEP